MRFFSPPFPLLSMFIRGCPPPRPPAPGKLLDQKKGCGYTDGVEQKSIYKENLMDKVDYLVKGIPNQLLNMFRGFCTMAGKTEGEGIIDLMIEYIEKNSAGDKSNFKKVVDEYRATLKKKK
jgi:hypothetical protein